MSLSDIKKNLYKKEEEQNSEVSDAVKKVSAEKSGLASNEGSVQDEWDNKGGELGKGQKRVVKIGIIIASVILGAFLIFAGIYEYRQRSFSEERVVISVSGPEESESGRLINFEIKYSNDNRASLENAEIVLNYPDSFRPVNNEDFEEDGATGGKFKLGEIKSGTSSKIVFSGKAYSPRGSLVYIKADLRYVPSGLSSQLSEKNQIGVLLTSSPLDVEVLAPANIPSGDAIDYQINYKNTGQDDLDDIRIKAEYPDGFSFSRSVPMPADGENSWNIGRITAGQEGKIVISGKLEGVRDEIMKIKAYAGTESQETFMAYNEGQAGTKIISSPLSIFQEVNGKSDFIANAGDTLMFNIKYRNEGAVGLRDVIIAQKIDSPVLDYETLDIRRGAFDISNRVITWKASDYPELKTLESGQEGNISFSIKVKDVIPVASTEDKNFVISSIAKIDSPDIPTPIEMNKIIAGNKIDIKLNSKIVLDVRGFYNDSILPNSGPIPPRVGQDTTYTIHWVASNVSNDITDAKVETVLPTGVSMIGVYPVDAKIIYNERNNSVVWEMGSVGAGEGVLSSPREVAFQVKINPAPAQVGKAVDLVGPSTFSASDLFTGESLLETSESRTTNLTEDVEMGTNYKVVN